MEEVGWQVEREQERILGFRTNTMPPTLGKEVRCSEGQSLPFGGGGFKAADSAGAQGQEWGL